MAVNGLLEVLGETDELKRIVAGLENGVTEQGLVGAAGSQKNVYIATLFRRLLRVRPGAQLLVITCTPFHAEKIFNDLTSLLPNNTVLQYPALDVLPHEEVPRDPDALGARLGVLERLSQRLPALVVTSVDAVSRTIIPPEVFRRYCLGIQVSQRVDLEAIERSLVRMGYRREGMVEGKGQFSIRGGIIDVFSASAESPVRIELFDDEVESVRWFDPATQRSSRQTDKVFIGPAREFLLEAETAGEEIGRIEQEAALQVERLKNIGNEEAAGILQERIAEHLEKLRNGVVFESAEQYKPFFYPPSTIIDYLNKSGQSFVVADEPARSRESIGAFEEEMGRTGASLLEKGHIIPSWSKNHVPWPELFAGIKKFPVVYFSSLSKRVQGMNPRRVINISFRTPDSFHGKESLFVSEIKRWRKENYKILIVLSTSDRCERVNSVLREDGVPAISVKNVDGEIKAGSVVITEGNLSSGFEMPVQKIVVLTDTEVYGKQKRKHRVRTSVEDSAARITHYTDLKEGDYVVHVNHGIGQYLGVETLEIGGVHKDYLVVKYQGQDKLYVPTDQVDLLQKYLGGDGDTTPRLSKLGGTEWARVKKKVKESVQEMAKGLLELYATRETIKGTAFSKDTVWQREFEDSFPYEETLDQIRAVEEVKRDMERPRPMDRLLCGDVGYGKTEVAIRAAFKAVMDGKQVAVLVPTTILAQQHDRTFRERFEGYPVKLALLSRFQSPSQQEKVIKDLASGAVDIVIGTHRLLSKDVQFKDLGLVIIDEEQRFGVAQKERLKELRTSVDVLTLTATPIPRTLHMALVSVRDMSVIETPPEDRYPVRTYVVEYNDDIVREAILRELSRDGQVYFVYNRIQTIDTMAAHLSKLVPEARIAVAHGQMDEHKLERVMLEFLDGEYDILLCTTIIETGMDISNVNTLIVYDADYMGLAQLYQLRGRVGRTNRVAYAYFTYRKDKILTEDAEKRLQAIREFTELGSGFKIAMKDLEIRGAGNILGPEQHGFIASVGFELYCKLLEESIRELKGEVVQRPPEPVIDLNIDAYVSDQYVQDSQQKVEIYKKVVVIKTLREVSDLEEELVDRFGPMPEPTRNLLQIAGLKVYCRELGVASLTSEKDSVVIRFLPGLGIPWTVTNSITRRLRGKVSVAHGRSPQIRIKTKGLSSGEILDLIEQVLTELRQAWTAA